MVPIKSSVATIATSFFLTFPSFSLGDTGSKAPAGTKDNAIRVAGFCLGQATARAEKITEVLKAADTNAAAYFGGKVMSIGNQIRWFYKGIVAVGNSVENPDPKIFTESKNIGESKGAALFEIENRCLKSCSASSKENELSSCVDACAEQEDSKLVTAINECGNIYSKALAASTR